MQSVGANKIPSKLCSPLVQARQVLVEEGASAAQQRAVRLVLHVEELFGGGGEEEAGEAAPSREHSRGILKMSSGRFKIHKSVLCFTANQGCVDQAVLGCIDS